MSAHISVGHESRPELTKLDATGRRSSTSFREHTHTQTTHSPGVKRASRARVTIVYVRTHSHPKRTHMRTRRRVFVCVTVCLCSCVRQCVRSAVHLYLSEEYNSLISFREHNRKSSCACASLVSSRFVSAQRFHSHRNNTTPPSHLTHRNLIYIYIAQNRTDRRKSARGNSVNK